MDSNLDQPGWHPEAPNGILTIQTAPGGVQVIPDNSARLLVGPTKNQPLEKIPLKFS